MGSCAFGTCERSRVRNGPQAEGCYLCDVIATGLGPNCQRGGSKQQHTRDGPTKGEKALTRRQAKGGTGPSLADGG